jgi:hypothetical protein
MLDQLVPALLLLAQPAPTPRAQRLALDLARAGETRTERVAVGQPFVVDVLNRAPGARYRLTAVGQSRLVEPLRLDEIAGRWRATAGCETAIQALADFGAVREESDVEGLFSVGGAGNRVIGSRCPGTAEFSEAVSPAAAVILSAAKSDGLGEGAIFELVVDRLMPTSESPVRTWRLRVEPQTLRVDSPDLTEAAWLVEATARDILEMLFFAAKRIPGKEVRFKLTPQQAGSPSLEISAEGVGSGLLTQRLDLHGGIWAPAVYSGWATALARRLGVKGSAQAPPEPVAGRLAHPVASVLEAENQRISNWLGRDMRSPDAHEQAALLLSALALRESAGDFSDSRLTLCRMSAHLAVARALRAGSSASPDGTLAEIAILALSKRQKDALDALGRLRAEHPGQQAWARALRLTSTGDWRTLPGALTATLLERLEYCRALRDRLSGLHALEFVRSRNSEAIPDWGRIGLSEGFSTEEGNTYAPTALALELAEVRQVYRLHQGRDPDPSAVGRALNAPPDRCLSREAASTITPRVIDWGAWARFYQRHVLAATVRQERALGQRLQLAEDAGEARQTQSMIEGLELQPLASLHGSERQLLERACLAVAPLLEHSRHLLTASHWSSLKRTCGKTAIAPVLAGAETWFGGLAPAGTAFDFEARRFLLKPDDPAALAELYRLAPYDRDIVRAWYRRERNNPPSPSAIESAYGVLLEYDIAAMKLRALLAARDVDEYQRLYSRICDLDADSCLDLGDYLASHNRPEAAVTAFRRALNEGKGRVRISARLDWLIDHSLEQGRTDDALAVARKAATGSAAGLKTMARVLERLERWTEAERYWMLHRASPVTIEERAERVARASLSAFYERFELWLSMGGCRTQQPAAIRGVFPSGIESASLAESSGRPDMGVRISGPDRTLEGLGLESDDIIVALDGRRVRSPLQYRCVAEFAEGTDAKAIAWRPKLERYLEVARAPRRPSAQLKVWLWLRPASAAR